MYIITCKKFDGFQNKMATSALKMKAISVYQGGHSKLIFTFENFDLHTFLT